RSAFERRDQRLGDDLEWTAGDLTRLAQPRERVPLGQAFLLHQQSLCALDRLASSERVGEGLRLLSQCNELFVTRARSADRREEGLLTERLDEVPRDARPPPPRDAA